MTEFNTPTEAEMNTFQEIFAKMQGALLAGSQLSKDFDALKVEVEGLRRDLQSVRNTNMALDDALTASRQRRDELETQLGIVRQERNSKVQKLEVALSERNDSIFVLKQQSDIRNAELSAARDTLRETCNERDTAQLRVLELEEENESIKKQLAQVTEAMEAVQRALHPMVAVKEEPKPQAEPVAEPAQTDTDIPQREGETTFQYYDRVGRYPSEREARAAAQPRSDDGKFQSEPVAASPKWDEGGWR